MTRHDIGTNDSRERSLAWDILRNSATMRMVAATGGPRRRSPRVESPFRLKRLKNKILDADRRYFQRRSEEEGSAANAAASTAARKAHNGLSELYARLAAENDERLDGMRHWRSAISARFLSAERAS